MTDEFRKLDPRQRLGDASIEGRHRELMRKIARILDGLFNGNDADNIGRREVGFVLMVFPYDDYDGRCNYISNGADRRDVAVLMKDMIARLEGQPEAEGRAR